MLHATKGVRSITGREDGFGPNWRVAVESHREVVFDVRLNDALRTRCLQHFVEVG